jgi:peptide-methionine (S)-S-oxide reductase
MNTHLASPPNKEEIRQALRDAGAKDTIFSLLNRGDEAAALEMLSREPSLRDAVGPIFFTPLHTAARAGAARVASALVELGAPVDGANPAGNTPLWLACQSDAVAEGRIAVAALLLERGANPRRECGGKSTPLHFAAWRGPIGMVELLLRHNAKEWQSDKDGKTPLDYAKDGVGADRDAIVDLLTRPVIRDPAFKAAVAAIHAGDLDRLRALLAERPNLALDRAVEPECYQPGYFKDPKLLWFVANNPTLMTTMPANVVALAESIIDAGVETADLDYTLGLVLTSDTARDQGHQFPLVKLLRARGATVTPTTIHGTLGYGLGDVVSTLVADGLPVTASIAAGLGSLGDLARLLPAADEKERHAALSMAVINKHADAARLCLEAGANVNAFILVHAHSTPAHQAAVNDDVPTLRLLVEHGANLDVQDTLWNGTPLGWAVHMNKPAAEAYLRSVLADRERPLVPSPGTPGEG